MALIEDHDYTPGYDFPEGADDYTDPLCGDCGGLRGDHRPL